MMMGLALGANAQSGMNSPYSQYGLGLLSDQTSGFNRGMNGVGIGFHEHNHINYLNPASYSSIDSLTFILDAGISGQITNFSENGKRKNAKNANFEYVVAGMRVAKHVGVSFGIIPFSSVGYSYSSSSWVDKTSKEDSYTNTYEGDGGFHQAYIGVGWSPVKHFSIGANVSYLWGKYSRTATNAFSNSAYNQLIRTYSAQVSSYQLSFGAQYTFRMGKRDWLTAGVTFSPKHNLGADAEMSIVKSASSVADTAKYSIPKALSLPNMWGVGLMWNHAGQVKVGVDYTLQQWGSLSSPAFEDKDYVLTKGYYSDRHKVNVGAQYCNDEHARTFFRRVQYRVGASYATPYFKVNGKDGPKELSVSAGFGIPIVNSYNNRSFLNISGQWVRSSCKDYIKENIFRINIGFTFNEDWFKKWKMQ